MSANGPFLTILGEKQGKKMSKKRAKKEQKKQKNGYMCWKGLKVPKTGPEADFSPETIKKKPGRRIFFDDFTANPWFTDKKSKKKQKKNRKWRKKKDVRSAKNCARAACSVAIAASRARFDSASRSWIFLGEKKFIFSW
jgi:hypothetical protein